MTRRTWRLTSASVCWCVAVSTVMACLASFGETRGFSGISPITQQKWAVIIGVSRYEDPGLRSIPNAARDAKSIYETLTNAQSGFPAKNVVLLVDDAPNPLHVPTRSNVLAMLSQWVKLAGPNDSLLIYFAGHGVDLKGKLYLMPSDGRTADIADTGIPYAVFDSKLDSSRAGRSVVILDACHSGTGRGTSQMTPGMMDDIERHSKGRITLASCSTNELSHEYNNQHGAFTWFLLKGLSGAADENKDGEVSALELSRYAYEQTRRWAAQNGLSQTPRLLANVSGDIVLLKVGVNNGKIVVTAPDQGKQQNAHKPAVTPPEPPGTPVVYLSKDASHDSAGDLDLSSVVTVANRFQDNGDGTVRDKYLNVEWQKSSRGVMTQDQAISACRDMRLGGKTGWRLPTVGEMQSLIRRKDATFEVDTQFFEPNDKENRFWAVESKGRKSYTTINFANKNVMRFTKDNYFAVRAVRDLSP